jgi:hypothetical protein
MRNGLVLSAFGALILAAVAGACTNPTQGTVRGTTLTRICGGVAPEPGEDPCSAPQPASLDVTFTSGDTIVASTRSDDAGQFRVTLAPGTYTARASVGDFPVPAGCDAVNVTVTGPPGPAPISLVCTYFAP